MGRLRFAAVIVAASAGGALAGPSYDVTIDTDPAGAKVTFDHAPAPACDHTPCTVQQPSGAIRVVIELDGYAQVEDTIELPSVDRPDVPVRLFAKLVKLASPPLVFARTLEPADGDQPSPRESTSVDASARSKPEMGDRIVVTGALDIGFREFTYKQGLASLSNYSQTESGQLAGLAVEVFPTRAVPGLSVFGAFELPLAHEQVALDTSQLTIGTATQTDWGRYEAGLRYHVRFADLVAVELGAAYLDERMSYSGTDLSMVPDTEYQSIAIRERASWLSLEPLEPYVEIETRDVMSIGNLETRFQSASAAGYHVALGAAVRSGRFMARLEAGVTDYSLTLQSMPVGPDQAQGASDSVVWVSMRAGVAY